MTASNVDVRTLENFKRLNLWRIRLSSWIFELVIVATGITGGGVSVARVIRVGVVSIRITGSLGIVGIFETFILTSSSAGRGFNDVSVEYVRVDDYVKIGAALLALYRIVDLRYGIDHNRRTVRVPTQDFGRRF